MNKETFIETYNKYAPNKWTKFAYKYFSKSTEKENMKPGKAIVGFLMVSFLIGMVGTIMKWPRELIAAVTYSYGALLAVLVIFLLIAVWMNNARIKKISKELDITLQDFNEMSDEWLK